MPCFTLMFTPKELVVTRDMLGGDLVTTAALMLLLPEPLLPKPPLLLGYEIGQTAESNVQQQFSQFSQQCILFTHNLGKCHRGTADGQLRRQIRL